jgi:hypothetical protein
MPTCPEHPDQNAVHKCKSCGDPYCDRCVSDDGYEIMVCFECRLIMADVIDSYEYMMHRF